MYKIKLCLFQLLSLYLRAGMIQGQRPNENGTSTVEDWSYEEFGNHTVHYINLNNDFLENKLDNDTYPNIATRYSNGLWCLLLLFLLPIAVIVTFKIYARLNDGNVQVDSTEMEEKLELRKLAREEEKETDQVDDARPPTYLEILTTIPQKPIERKIEYTTGPLLRSEYEEDPPEGIYCDAR